MATLEIKNVSKFFGRTEVIRDVSLQVEDGELIVFVGPSGCGKSTMLRMIAGLEKVSAGEIWIGGRQVDHLPPARRGIAMVFQSYALYPHKDVRGNLGFALRHARVKREEIERRVNEAAEILELTELMDRKPRELSGGQRQRVAIGRAIVREPDVFLFDEPLSNLDAALRVHMRVEILKLHQRLGNNTMIYVTHDQVEAMTLADRIAVFRDGKVEQSGTPMELYRKPVNDFVAGFIGSPSMNFLNADWNAETGQLLVAGWQLDATALQQAGFDLPQASLSGLKLGVRPEHLSLSTQGQFTGSVQVFENLGGESFVHVNPGGDEVMVAKLEGEHHFRPGDSCCLEVNPAFLHLFDADGQRLS